MSGSQTDDAQNLSPTNNLSDDSTHLPTWRAAPYIVISIMR